MPIPNIDTDPSGCTILEFQDAPVVPSETDHMKTLASMIVVSVVAMSLTGCNNNRVTYKSVTSDLTPELQATAQTPREFHNDFAVMANTNLRGFWDDLARVFYTDHPSRLSPYPITYTGGNPR